MSTLIQGRKSIRTRSTPTTRNAVSVFTFFGLGRLEAAEKKKANKKTKGKRGELRK